MITHAVPDAVAVYLFGSVAQDEAGVGSDMDIFVEADTALFIPSWRRPSPDDLNGNPHSVGELCPGAIRGQRNRVSVLSKSKAGAITERKA